VLNTQVKEKVQLYIYFPSWPSWPVLERILPLSFFLNKSQPEDAILN